MKPRIRIFFWAVAAASLIGCAHQAEPSANSQSDRGKGLDIYLADSPGISEMRSARAQLEWRRANEEKRPATPLY